MEASYACARARERDNVRPTREFQVFRLTSDLHETTRTYDGVVGGTTKENEPVSNRVGSHS